MRVAILRGWIAGALLAAIGVAQRTLQAFDCAESQANLAKFTGKDENLGDDLGQLLGRMLDDGTRAPQSWKAGRGKLALQGTAEQFALVRSSLEQLRRRDLQELRLQCTLVAMPLAVATAAGFAPGKPVAVDEAKASRLIQDAVAQKGVLRNLPEAALLPLEPEVIGKPLVEPKHRSALEDAMRRSFLTAQAMPLAADEAWFTLEWRAVLPEERIGPAPVSRFATDLRIKTGAGAMALFVKDQQVMALWVRFPCTKAAEVHNQPADKAPPAGT